MVVSWPIRAGFFNQAAPIAAPETSEAGVELIQKFADTWAEPFRSLAHGIPRGAEVKSLELYDWPPPKGLRTTGHVALVGDALHPMAMCRCPLISYSSAVVKENSFFDAEKQTAARAPTTPSSTCSTWWNSSSNRSSPAKTKTRTRTPPPPTTTTTTQ
jgi:hypothetical protein